METGLDSVGQVFLKIKDLDVDGVVRSSGKMTLVAGSCSSITELSTVDSFGSWIRFGNTKSVDGRPKAGLQL